MEKFKKMLDCIHSKICKNKEDCKCKNNLFLLGKIISLIIVVFGLFYIWNYFFGKTIYPEVIWANFSLEYRKIPFDTKTLEISFSTDLKKESITNKTIQLSPFVDWIVSLKNWNTIVYSLKNNLEIWQEYSLTINDRLESENWKKLKEPYIVLFEAISGAKVTKIIPDKTLNNISQNVLVLFNIPLVPLTSLQDKQNLPCPVEITPKIKWKCSWTSGNIIEFIPDSHWEWATEYKIRVNNVDWLLYPLKETKEVTFKTPDLEVNISNTFSPTKWIWFYTNFPIDKNVIAKKLNLSKNENNIISQISLKLEEEKWSETRFWLKPAEWNFSYSTTYNLSIPAWLDSKYWNQPTKSATWINITSTNYITSIEPYANEYSETWALIDAPDYIWNQYIPSSNVFFVLNFDEEVWLNKNLFNFVSKDNKNIDFDIKYWHNTEYDKKWNPKEIESKQKIVLTIKNNLELNNQYSLIISKSANPNLKADEIHNFFTPKKFEITDFQYVDNSLACVYFNNDIKNNWIWEEEIKKYWISTTPWAIIRWLSKDRQDYMTQKYSCPQKSWLNAYLLNFRLDKFKDYTISIPKILKDSYNNNLANDYSYKVKSWDIKESDKYIYSSFNKNINVIPASEPTIIDIQSINLDKINLEICEMGGIWYWDYVNNYYNNWFAPKCINSQTKEVSLKNKNWILSHNKFDIEKDVIWSSIKSPIYLIRSRVSWNNYTDDWRWFSNLIIKTNLSLTFEKANNKSLIFATSLDGKDTPNNLIFEWYKKINDSKFEKVANIKSKWIEDKKVYEISGEPEIIIAKNDKYYSVVNTYSDQTSNYDFKYISGQDSATKSYLYLYTERPIYRPGDTVFFKWILRDFRFDWYHKSSSTKWKLKILDENYNFFKDVDITIDKNSNFNGSFELPKTMSLWKYSFEFTKGTSWESVYNDAKFFVEEYKKPVFKININWDKKEAQLWDKVNVNYNTEYYFWWRMWWAHFYSSVISQDYFFDAKWYNSYQFWDSDSIFNCNYWWYCNYNDSVEYSEEWAMSADWEWKINYEFKKDIEWEKIYSFNLTAEDPDTKKQVSNSYSVVLHNTDAYVWLNSSYYNDNKNWIKLNWVVLNYEAQPLSKKKVKIELIKREWKEVKKQWVDWVFYNDYSVEEVNESSNEYYSKSNWEFDDTLIPKWEWEYMIKATYTWDNNKSYVTTQYVYVAWKESYFWWEWNNTTTDMVADKNMLKIWDTANFTLKSPVSSGKIFVSIEKDDWILDYFTQDIKSNWDRISVPIKSNYYPNIYVKVFLVGKNLNNPLPIYKRALNVVKIVNDDKKLKISIKPEKNHYLPWEKVTLNISIKDWNWTPAPWINWSISIVDESLLALKWNPKKNPFAFFYDMKRYLWVETYLSLFNLVEKLEIKDISDWEKWWAWEWAKWWDSKKKRWVFKDTAFWQADYTTDKDWKAKITSETLPDNLTTWVIESVASSWDDTKIWVWEATITTTKKVIVNENTPRFLWSNDEITISPVIFNKTWKDSIFTVTLSWTNIDINDKEQKIKINNWAQKTVDFDIKVKDLASIEELNNVISKIDIKAVAEETKDEDEVERSLMIIPTSIKETVATIWSTENKSFTEKIDLTNIALWWVKLVINYASSILWNLTNSISFLREFSYTCLEQNQSSIMPEVYLKKLYTSIWLPYDLTKQKIKVWVDSYDWYKEISKDELIKNYIAESLKYQKPSGWFGYWTDMSIYQYADFDLTSIIVKWMSDIKIIWYTNNEKSLKDAISYLKKRFYENKIEWCYYEDIAMCKYNETERLDAINAILSYSQDDYEAYKMYKILNLKEAEISTKINQIKVIAKLLKVKNITSWEKDELKKAWIELSNKIITDYIVYNPRWAFIWKDSYNSRILNTSNFIWAISDLWLDNFKDISQIVDNMNRWVISQKVDGSFWSTQETSVVIENSAKYMMASGELKDSNWIIKLLLNWEKIDEKIIDKNTKLTTFTNMIKWDKLKTLNDFLINKEWSWKVYYDLSLSYFLPVSKVTPKDEWFYLDQNYFDYNEYSKIKNLKDKEWTEYMSWNIDYNDLKYPKDTTSYLTPINSFKVGQIVLVNNRVITSEPRDQVAFEWFIPSWSELINTALSTEDQKLKMEKIFDKQELRDDRFFWYSNKIDAWEFSFKYLLRITHDWSFNLKPSQISEFYHSEVFWRNEWRNIKVR